jgi:hypothetical protein
MPSEILPKVDHFIGKLEMWYAADFERRLAEATELLRAQITADLLAQFNAELKSQVENVRREYDEKLKSRTHDDSGEEIARTEAAILKCSSELEALTPDDAAGMARLLQRKTEQLELRAYLRGLQRRSRKAEGTGNSRETSDPIQTRPVSQLPPPPLRRKAQWPSLQPSFET